MGLVMGLVMGLPEMRREQHGSQAQTLRCVNLGWGVWRQGLDGTRLLLCNTVRSCQRSVEVRT